MRPKSYALKQDWTSVVALAYSPSTGGLYAADAAQHMPERGGIYRLDDDSEPGRPMCRAVKIAEVRRPTSLVCGPDGAIYVTTLGDADDQGRLLKITGDL